MSQHETPARNGRRLSDIDTGLIDRLTTLACRLADAARGETLPRFRSSGLGADNKAAEGFDPVTEADREAERAIRGILAVERPEDGILGEEQEGLTSRSGLTWVIDPVDGTRAFISGIPTWGTLIALDDGTRGRIGLVDQPYTDERFLGVPGHGAWLERGGIRRPIRARRTLELSAATLMTTAPEMFAPEEQAAFGAVSARARLTRYGIDCYAYALLALGQIDLVVEAGLGAYDIAAPKALIEAAGGIVTDWQGGDCRSGGRVIAAATPELHGEVLALLSALA